MNYPAALVSLAVVFTLYYFRKPLKALAAVANDIASEYNKQYTD